MRVPAGLVDRQRQQQQRGRGVQRAGPADRPTAVAAERPAAGVRAAAGRGGGGGSHHLCRGPGHSCRSVQFIIAYIFTFSFYLK